MLTGLVLIRAVAAFGGEDAGGRKVNVYAFRISGNFAKPSLFRSSGSLEPREFDQLEEKTRKKQDERLRFSTPASYGLAERGSEATVSISKRTITGNLNSRHFSLSRRRISEEQGENDETESPTSSRIGDIGVGSFGPDRSLFGGWICGPDAADDREAEPDLCAGSTAQRHHAKRGG